ncbi:MAG: HD domain-containing protein [Rhodocyclaceae bacterium]|nr:HD domain-containing protein [Rhodocyclaceae bacterium]
MEARHLSPIDHIDHNLLDTFVQHGLPDALAPLQHTLATRLVHPCRLSVIWLDRGTRRIAACIDASGRRKAPGQHDPQHVDDSPALRACIQRRAPVPRPSKKDRLIAWIAEDDFLPLVCLPLQRGDTILGALIVLQRADATLPPGADAELQAWLPMMATLLVHEIDAIHGLFGAIRFARDFTLMRDTETGQHQLRIGGYARILARALEDAHGLDERFAQEVALYAPLHDIGKVGIPDELLLKPGKFDAEERERMQAHAANGAALIDRLIEDFGLAGNPRIDTLRAIVAWHHEYLDGSGYPEGRSGDDIPLATRIITICDIFDALTNVRAYKQRWSLDEAFELLKSMADKSQLDKECMQAFLSQRKRLTEVWHNYATSGV